MNWRSRTIVPGDIVTGAAVCAGLAVLLLVWAIVVTPIAWMLRLPGTLSRRG